MTAATAQRQDPLVKRTTTPKSGTKTMALAALVPCGLAM